MEKNLKYLLLKIIKENKKKINVIIDISERRKMIEEMISKSLLEDEKADVDEGLLDEVTNLVEYPLCNSWKFLRRFLRSSTRSFNNIL